MSDIKFLLECDKWLDEDNICYNSNYNSNIKIFSRYPLIIILDNGPLNHPSNDTLRFIDRYHMIDGLLDKDEYLISNIFYTRPYIVTNKRSIKLEVSCDIAPWNGLYDLKKITVNNITFKMIPFIEKTDYVDWIEYTYEYDKNKHNLIIISKKIFTMVFPQGSNQMYGPKPYIPDPIILTKLIENQNLPVHKQVLVYKEKESLLSNNIKLKKDLDKIIEDNDRLNIEVKKLQIDYELKEKELEEKYRQKHIELEKYYVKREQQISSLLINKLEKEMIEIIKQEI